MKVKSTEFPPGWGDACATHLARVRRDHFRWFNGVHGRCQAGSVFLEDKIDSPKRCVLCGKVIKDEPALFSRHKNSAIGATRREERFYSHIKCAFNGQRKSKSKGVAKKPPYQKKPRPTECRVKGCGLPLDSTKKNPTICSYHVRHPCHTLRCPLCYEWMSRRSLHCIRHKQDNLPRPRGDDEEYRDMRNHYRERIADIGNIGRASRDRLPVIERIMVKHGLLTKEEMTEI